MYDAERKQDFLKKERLGKIKFDLPFIIGKICFPALLLVLIFQALLREKFSTVFGAVLEGLLVLMNSYLNMKWV